jgi:hypothetical protein
MASGALAHNHLALDHWVLSRIHRSPMDRLRLRRYDFAFAVSSANILPRLGENNLTSHFASLPFVAYAHSP